MAIERFGHPNEGINTSAIREPEQVTGDKRKFKPKAVGGIAILLDSQIGKEVFLRPTNATKHDGEHSETTKNGSTDILKQNTRDTSNHEAKKTQAVNQITKDDGEIFVAAKQDSEDIIHHCAKPKSGQEIKKTSPVFKSRNMSRELREEKNGHSVPITDKEEIIPTQRISRENTKTELEHNDKIHSPSLSGNMIQVPSQKKNFNGKINEKEIVAVVSHLLAETPKKRSPPPVSPRQKRKIISSPVPRQEQVKRNSNEYFKRTTDSSDLDNCHLFVDLEKRSRSVSPAASGRFLRSDSPFYHLEHYNDVENDECDYIEMDADNWNRPPAVLPVNKRPVGGVKLFPEGETITKITKKSTTSPGTPPKSQFTPETSPVEYKLMFENKRDSITIDSAQFNTGTLVTPKSVNTYTIQTSPKHTTQNTEPEVKYVRLLNIHSKTIETNDDEDEYVLPFEFSTDRKSYSEDDIIYASIENDHSIYSEYVNTSAFIKERKSSLEGNTPRRVTSATYSNDDNCRSRSMNATRKIRINDIGSSPKFISTSVPDLLSVDQSIYKSPPDSLECLFLNGGKGLSLESPLVHRISVVSTDSSESRRSVPLNEKHKKVIE